MNRARWRKIALAVLAPLFACTTPSMQDPDPPPAEILEELLFWRAYGGVFLNSIREDGSGLTEITRVLTGCGSGASWSPDGGQISYSPAQYTRCIYGGLFVANADGSGRRQITVGPPFKESGYVQYDLYPDWSPAGDAIVFYRAFDTAGGPVPPSGIYTVTPDGSAERRVVDVDLPRSTVPLWSPDGTRIVYSRNDTSADALPPGIYVIGADGSGESRITTAASDGSPRWLDNERIMFWRMTGSVAGSWHEVRTDGSGLAELHDVNAGRARNADGSKVAYVEYGPDYMPGYTDLVIARTNGEVINRIRFDGLYHSLRGVVFRPVP